ncbi:acyltransferase [Maribacter confluentis]|uniref:Acyltransferase n=1 Tax=Maribacter confluentis TaxID=1656093 RepID=A0ABT8RUK7_9FLAO|nr:acyltransferase [Maribacter confluentis]MDO1514318.1 acyltransferase [Maribacter confluentis]
MNYILNIYWKIYALKNLIFNKITFKRKDIIYTDFPKISGIILITGQGRLELGTQVKFNSSRRSNPIGGDTKMIIDLGVTGNLKIGNYTGISNATIIAHDNVVIGENVKIGGSVKIYDTDFHSLQPTLRKKSETDIPNTKSIHIKNNTFIGAHSIILKGVTIGENSIIGAGSVITKSIPDNEIWGGNPAKFIKKIELLHT